MYVFIYIVLCLFYCCVIMFIFFMKYIFFFKQKTAYEMRISDWSSDVCSSDLLGVSDPVLDVARELEQIALNDEYFIDKKLYPNVDFYSVVIISAIGFPTSMFTALFSLARTVGSVAPCNTMISVTRRESSRERAYH